MAEVLSYTGVEPSTSFQSGKPVTLPADGEGRASASPLPCLKSHNSTKEEEKFNVLTGSHRKTAHALKENIIALAAQYGVERLGFLTLTFADHVTCVKEAQRRFNSLSTHVLRKRYLKAIAIVERQQSRRIHYHLVVVLQNDI